MFAEKLRAMCSPSYLLLIFMVLHTWPSPQVECVAVMSVDLGSEWMKVAIVSPGVPMEIALNRESQRKTPVAIAFRDGERFFGDMAMNLGARFPEKVYVYILDLLGKKLDNPVVDLYKTRFPYYNITADSERGTVVLNHPEGMSFTPEELVAMILRYAQEIARKATEQPVNDVVITVPPFFNQPERRALLKAAELAGLKVLQLMNSNTAAALHYGVFRRKDFNDTAQNILFYDMGASSTTATVASYQMVKSKERGFVETNPQLTIKGVGFDRSLGGLDMQLRLRDYLGKAFNGMKKTKQDVLKNNRALAKLFIESGRLKKVLSANTEHTAQVENLIDDQDFKNPMTREELENLCQDLYDRATIPVETALKSSGMTLEEINQVILVGAGTRVPRIQQRLLDMVQQEELGKSLNTDEAVALGAVYQAAFLSKGFKVKTFNVKDANLYPIQVDFQRDYDKEDGQKGIRVVRRTLFGRNNPFPQKKVMTFTRHTSDFEFDVNYGDLDFLPEFELKSLGSFNLSHVKVAGVSVALDKHKDDGSELKGVKAKFHLDDSGLLSLDLVESVFEKKVEEEEKLDPEAFDMESTLAKLGSTIGKLFSAAAGEEEPDTEPSTTEQPPQEAQEEENAEEKPVQSEETGKEAPKDDGQNKTESNEGEKTNASSVNETATGERPTKIVTIKEPISVEETKLDLVDMTADSSIESKEKLIGLEERDRAKLARDKAHNFLESFIVETKDKLYTKEYEVACTAAEKENILQKLSEAGEWLEYESDDAETKVFQDKIADLKSLTREMFDRVKEHRDRPEAVQALTEMLNLSSVFLQGAKNASQTDQIFTDVELTTLEKLIEETKGWLSDQLKLQGETPLTVHPKLTTKAVAEKIAGLDREVKYMLNKARFATPKARTETNETKKSPESDTTKDTKAKKSSKKTKEDETKEEADDETLALEADVLPETETTSEVPQPSKTTPDQAKEPNHTEL